MLAHALLAPLAADHILILAQLDAGADRAAVTAGLCRHAELVLAARGKIEG